MSLNKNKTVVGCIYISTLGNGLDLVGALMFKEYAIGFAIRAGFYAIAGLLTH